MTRTARTFYAASVSGIASTLLSLVMLAVFALTAGGVYLLARRRDRKRGALMLAAAFVFLLNVLIWTLPG